MRARNGTAADLWETWRQAQARSGLALKTWYAAPQRDKARAYATYTAALEREALMADLLAQAAVDGAVAAA